MFERKQQRFMHEEFFKPHGFQSLSCFYRLPSALCISSMGMSLARDGFSKPQHAKNDLSNFFCLSYPIPSMYGIFTHIPLVFMVNVGKYTIHG